MYPEDTIGGMLQQAWLWPGLAGIVTMVAIWQLWWAEEDNEDSVNDCVLICLVTAVEKFLRGVEGEKGRLAGDFILVTGVSGTCFRAAECNLRELNEVAYVGRPERFRCEGMMTVFELELGYCVRIPRNMLRP